MDTNIIKKEIIKTIKPDISGGEYIPNNNFFIRNIKLDYYDIRFNFFKIQQPERDNSESEHRNKNIVQKYLCNVDETFIDMNSFVKSTDVCQSCYKGELIPLDDEGVLICNNNLCAVSIPYLIENEKPSYKEPPKEVCFYAYKKINHLNEILNQFQAKESTIIPEEVMNEVAATALAIDGVLEIPHCIVRKMFRLWRNAEPRNLPEGSRRPVPRSTKPSLRQWSAKPSLRLSTITTFVPPAAQPAVPRPESAPSAGARATG